MLPVGSDGLAHLHKKIKFNVFLLHKFFFFFFSKNLGVLLFYGSFGIVSLPNFSLAPAIDVLTTGTYPRLPTCIKDKVVPLPPLTEAEEKDAAELLNFAIRHRLPAENIPDSMLVTYIGMLPSCC